MAGLHLICGIDEAGRGPVIGPLVVAGVTTDDEKELADLGVRDSKKLTPKRREKLASKIKVLCKWEIEVLSAFDIDEMRGSQSLNIIEASAFAIVLSKLRPTAAIVDAADVNEEAFAQAIRDRLDFSLDLKAKHQADNIYPVVSAASIIAKVERDHRVQRIEEELGKEIGSGYPSDRRTIDFLKNWIEEHRELPPYTRKSWKTVGRVLKEMGQTSIDSY